MLRDSDLLVDLYRRMASNPRMIKAVRHLLESLDELDGKGVQR